MSRTQAIGHHRYSTTRGTPHIVDTFGRGRDQCGPQITRVGLGPDPARRIVRGHGGDLSEDPTPGVGAVRAFDLQVAR
jgi:K+-sensing histidine kinase KdpD